MAIDREPCVYILANGFNGALYIGVTSALPSRMVQHRAGTFDGHTRKYGIHRLVYFETAATMAAAIVREKQLKRYRRDWKRNLIERDNPAWNDLAGMFGLEPLPSSSSFAVDPGTRPGWQKMRWAAFHQYRPSRHPGLDPGSRCLGGTEKRDPGSGPG